MRIYFDFISVGKVELFTKHDFTQYKLLASANDPKYSKTPFNYLSFASENNTQIDFFHNCKSSKPFIDTQIATKYAPIGHPLLLDDPNFDAPIDKRNCKRFAMFHYLSISKVISFFIFNLCRAYESMQILYGDEIRISGFLSIEQYPRQSTVRISSAIGVLRSSDEKCTRAAVTFCHTKSGRR